jgi:bifunctional non-homologous end joining protein LigD
MNRALDPYFRKRAAGRTPEPHGAGEGRRGWFVVQKHAARRLHYDLRLELGGVLKSWAVPQGPSFDPAVKRLAVRTEDHPLDYADFEGVIPEGNYGAGSVIVWDQGRWTAVEPADEGLTQGKLLFDLHGYKLRGRWTLVRTRARHRTADPSGAENWLLIKKPDRWSHPDSESPPSERSILSGLEVEALAHREERLRQLTADLSDLPDYGSRPLPRPMLAERIDRPFDDPAWLFELKYDGFRLMAEKDEDEVRLWFRSGKDATTSFPDLVRSLRRLPCHHAVVDGEVVILDEDARPSFQMLQRRIRPARAADGATAATLYAFDLLALEHKDVRGRPLAQRKRLLQQLVPPLGPVRYTDHIVARGTAMLEQVERMGLEGIVGKRIDAPYVEGRSADWKKLPLLRTEDFVVVGHTPPKGGRVGLGGLHLAEFSGGELLYVGRVGSGFDHADLASLAATLDAARMDTPACRGAPSDASSVWVRPELVAQVRYLQRTEEGLLRQPVFLGLRPDRSVADLALDEPGMEGEEDAPAPPDPPRDVAFVNLDKVFWPHDGTTKGDLIAYYREVSEWLLPLLRDRPAVLTRYPDGIEGKSFFQKNTPGFAPDWLRRARVWSEHAEREIDYLVLDDEPSLLYAANSGTIPLHVWASRLSSLAQPDWLILDLDPKGAPFEHVIQLARALRRLADELGLPAMVKTSGASGLHVLLPLGRQLTYEQTRQLGLLLAQVVVRRHPDIATVDRMIQARKGRVYIDVLQNGHGRLLVSAFSVRPLPGAPVSTPLHWREVKPGLDPSSFDIRSVPRRLGRQRKDPLAGLLTARPDLLGALEALQQLW